jgi:phosphomannomutase
MKLSDFAITFGTSGARGLVSDFTTDYCWTFTRAFLSILEPDVKGLIIGHDLRSSSPLIASRCMAAARASGVPVSFAGAAPTPALALSALSLGLPALMVTGSHIPADRNGIKAYRPEGEITKADERIMLAAEVPVRLGPLELMAHLQDQTVPGRYVSRYTDFFAPGALAGLRVGVYEHSTVARDLLHEMLRSLGAETVALARSEAFVAVDTEALDPEDHIRAVQWAREHRLDAIVSADGDADRPLLADETGTWMRGDVLGVLCAMELGAMTVVTPVSSNTVAEACGAFRHVVRTRIGSPHVIEAMASALAMPPVAGYEANGGFLLGSAVTEDDRRLAPLPTRDALLPLLLLLRRAKRRGEALSRLLRGLPSRFTHSARLQHVSADRFAHVMDFLERDAARLSAVMAPASGPVSTIDRTDGLRVTFGNTDIVHLRASGNAPELRCYAEADSPMRAQSLCNSCLVRASELLRD